MLELVAPLNYWQALGIVFLQLLTISLGAAFMLRRRSKLAAQIMAAFEGRALWTAFGLTFFTAFMTLVYSDLIGIVPCPLCWWQRIFLYPQVILLGMAAWKKDNYVAEYSIILSVFGAGVALYQHVLQIFPGSGLPCPAVGASCSQRILFEFGYVTYPLMAFTVFAFLLVTMLVVRSRARE